MKPPIQAPRPHRQKELQTGESLRSTIDVASKFGDICAQRRVKDQVEGGSEADYGPHDVDT